MWTETALSDLLSFSLFPSHEPWEIICLAEITKVPSSCHRQLMAAHIKYSLLHLTPSFDCDKSEKSECWGGWRGEGNKNPSDAFFLPIMHLMECVFYMTYVSSQVCYGQNGSNCQQWLSEKWHSLSLWGFLQVQFGTFHYVARIH